MRWWTLLVGGGGMLVLAGIALHGPWRGAIEPLSAEASDPRAPIQGDLTPAEASPLTGYLAQSLCIDAAGRATAALPGDPECARSRFATEDDPLPWRKHDWGGAGGPLAGWQASDAVLARRDGVSFVDQTFDFGAPATDKAGRPDAFYRFDENDGGDAIAIVGDIASAFLTQDGGTPGLQWFVGRGCDRPGFGRYIAWVAFRADMGADWRSLVAELGDEATDSCPARFNRAFTRYRLVAEAFPLQVLGAEAAPVRRTVTLQTVLTEHFDAGILAKAHTLERFYYAQGFGKVRWEAWSNDDRRATRADTFAQSGRCPALADSAPPDTGWRMLDCRMWTNIVADPARRDWRVRDFGWPPAGLRFKQAN